jgi:hypothetical protein
MSWFYAARGFNAGILCDRAVRMKLFDREKADAPAGLELERLVSEREGAAFFNISVDTLKRVADRGRIRRIAISPRAPCLPTA